MFRIEYYRKDAYGNTHYYVKPKLEAQRIQQLLGKKTITKEEMNIMSQLFKVEFVLVTTPEEEVPI
jgi:transcriptional regulator CtsR